MRKFLFLLACLLPLPATAQIVVDEQYEQYQPIEYSLQASPDSQAIWEIKPLSGQTRFSTRNYKNDAGTPVYAMWAEPGRYQLEATVVTVDFDNRTFDIKKHSKIFTVVSATPGPIPPPPGPGPTPPGPTPPNPSPIPADSFNNLGQRLNAKAAELNLQVDLRNRMAEIYSTAAKGMVGPNQKFFRIVDVRDFINQEVVKLNLDASWGTVRGLVVEEANKWTGASTLSWQEATEFYQAVSRGYKG